MEWVRCNRCFVHPNPAAKRIILLTSCGHLVCEKCRSEAKDSVCWECGKSCSVIKLANSSQMSQEIVSYFSDPVAMLKGLVQCAEFQKLHEDKAVEFRTKRRFLENNRDAYNHLKACRESVAKKTEKYNKLVQYAKTIDPDILSKIRALPPNSSQQNQTPTGRQSNTSQSMDVDPSPSVSTKQTTQLSSLHPYPTPQTSHSHSTTGSQQPSLSRHTPSQTLVQRTPLQSLQPTTIQQYGSQVLGATQPPAMQNRQIKMQSARQLLGPSPGQTAHQQQQQQQQQVSLSGTRQSPLYQATQLTAATQQNTAHLAMQQQTQAQSAMQQNRAPFAMQQAHSAMQQSHPHSVYHPQQSPLLQQQNLSSTRPSPMDTTSQPRSGGGRRAAPQASPREKAPARKVLGPPPRYPFAAPSAQHPFQASHLHTGTTPRTTVQPPPSVMLPSTPLQHSNRPPTFSTSSGTRIPPSLHAPSSASSAMMRSYGLSSQRSTLGSAGRPPLTSITPSPVKRQRTTTPQSAGKRSSVTSSGGRLHCKVLIEQPSLIKSVPARSKNYYHHHHHRGGGVSRSHFVTPAVPRRVSGGGQSAATGGMVGRVFQTLGTSQV